MSAASSSSGSGADLPLPPALLRRALASPPAVPSPELDAVFARVRGLDPGDRVAAWATFFLERGEATYRFGDEAGGYVTEGRLVDDVHTDCVLFVCRAVELAVSESPGEAVAAALARRFPGVPVGELVSSDGRIAYDHPGRLAFGWELAQSGGYGRDVTEALGTTVLDPGTSRYAAGEVRIVPRENLDLDRIANGDVIFFALDPDHSGAASVRRETGTVIGHMGIACRRGARVDLVHAASHDLPGEYAGGRIVGVDLGTYLRRVDRFRGVVVTRLGA